jgi:GTP-binding protein
MRILNAEYFKGTFEPENRGMSNIPEVCFIGRSNVGKSSMINTLVMQKVARTSSTPGATRMVNLYSIDYEYRGVRQQLIFSDFPGFGYSKVSKSTYMSWKKIIERYIVGNKFIRRLIWIFDVRRDMDALDEMLMEWIKDRGIDFTLVLTKIDKESRQNVAKKRDLFMKIFGDDKVFIFSSKDGYGRKELLSHIFSIADT